MPVDQGPEVKDKPKLPSPKDRHKVVLQTKEASDAPAEVSVTLSCCSKTAGTDHTTA